MLNVGPAPLGKWFNTLLLAIRQKSDDNRNSNVDRCISDRGVKCCAHVLHIQI